MPDTPSIMLVKYKNIKCGKPGNNLVLNNMTKIACKYHYNNMVKEYNKEKQLKLKEELKLAKDLEKQKLKAEKLANLQKNALNENIVIKLDKCNKILKTGPNKGKQCECKIFENNLCKRHSNLEK